MASADLLQVLLHLHLATDAAAISNLPLIISALPSGNLESSSHLAKWTNRVNALIHSREAGARWAGITLALHTSRLSRNVLISSAQGWVTTVLPTLSRSESVVVRKASIKLLAFIFTSTTNLAEFQRHVVTPNVPKFSSALLSLVEKQADEELRVLCLDVLATIVPLYPTIHRQIASALSTVSLNLLNGTSTFTPVAIISSASRLHAFLHVTGGKVAGSALWRRSVDETIVFCSTAVAALRTTYAAEDRFIPLHADPLVSVPLNLDRLRCGSELLCHLLRVKVERPVSVPIQSLVNLCLDTLSVTRENALRNVVDPSLRNTEAAAVPSILALGCSLTGCLARCVQSRLAPHLPRIWGVIAYQLEQITSINERLPLIKLLPSLFGSCLPPHEPLICGRVIKVILPPIASLLSQKSSEDSTISASVGGKKGKKRARGYEGDEVFNTGRKLLCETAEDAELVLAALDALPYLLRIPNIPPYLRSLSSRLLLSLLLALPKLHAHSVAHDPTVKDEIHRRVESVCIEFASGSSTVLCKSLPLVVDAIVDDEMSGDTTIRGASNQNMLLLDLMLHPRLPPLLRPLPPLDAIALSQSEEGTEERKMRESLRLHSLDNDIEKADEAFTPATAKSTQKTQQVVGAETDLAPVHSVSQELIIAPAVPLRRAAPLVVEAIVPMPDVPPSAAPSSAVLPTPQTRDAGPEADRPTSPGHGEEQDIPMKLPQQDARQSVQQPFWPSKPTRMSVDDEDDEDDIEIPALDPASPSDSEVE